MADTIKVNLGELLNRALDFLSALIAAAKMSAGTPEENLALAIAHGAMFLIALERLKEASPFSREAVHALAVELTHYMTTGEFRKARFEEAVEHVVAGVGHA